MVHSACRRVILETTSHRTVANSTTTTPTTKLKKLNRKDSKMNQIVATCAVFFHLLVALVVCFACVSQTLAATQRSALETTRLNNRIKRSLFELPDGADLLVAKSGGIRTSFSCDGLGYGYYADPDNDCKIFHICQSFKMSDGSIYNNHWSFVCGNQTVFNQVSLSCSHPEDAVPCESARDFYYVNDYFGDVRAPSVRDSDLGAAHELIARAYGSRLSSQQQQQ